MKRFCKIYTDICQISPQDLEAIYSENIIFIDPITTHTGLNQVKQYFSNLLVQARSCKFDVSDIVACNENSKGVSYVVNWEMTLILNNDSRTITLDGTSQLGVKDDLIVYHKDYYDLGEMVYEHIPLLGFVIKKIKRKLAQ